MSEITNTEATSPVDGPQTAVEGTGGAGVAETTGTVSQEAYDALKAELDTFKRDVVAVTGKYAEAHNLCGVTDTALAELGLRRVQTGHRVSVSLVASWDVKSSSRGKAGRPSDSTVWRSVETLAAVIRYDGVDEVKRRYARDGGDFPNLVIESATVDTTTMEPGPDAHIIPAVRKRTCGECGYADTPATSDNCNNCGDYFEDSNDDD